MHDKIYFCHALIVITQPLPFDNNTQKMTEADKIKEEIRKLTKVQEQFDSKGFLSKLFMSLESRKNFRLRAKLITKLEELVKTEERMAELGQQLTFLKILDGEDVFQKQNGHDSSQEDSNSLKWDSRWSETSRKWDSRWSNTCRKWDSTRERGFASSTVFNNEEGEENKSEPWKDASTQRTECSDDSDSYNSRTCRTERGGSSGNYSRAGDDRTAERFSHESSYQGGRNDDNHDGLYDEYEHNPHSSGGYDRYGKDGRGRSHGNRSRFGRDDQSFSDNPYEEEYDDNKAACRGNHGYDSRFSGGSDRYRREGRSRSYGARSRFERDDQSFSDNSYEDECYDDTTEDMDYEDEQNRNKRHSRGRKRSSY